MAYLELSVKLVKAQTVKIDAARTLHMLMLVARECETNQERKADSRADNALSSERHDVYICPLQVEQTR